MTNSNIFHHITYIISWVTPHKFQLNISMYIHGTVLLNTIDHIELCSEPAQLLFGIHILGLLILT